MDNGAVKTRVKGPNRYLEGLWQERIIWNITKNVLEKDLGHYGATYFRGGNVNQTLIWGQGSETYTLTWYRPNTHPIKPGIISKPEFGIAKDGVQVINIESKNWTPSYKPLSLYQVDKQIITRFSYVPAPNNILVISELKVEPTVAEPVQRLLDDNNVRTIILTHRKATSSYDVESHDVINKTLPSKLKQILKLGP
jgi:hypothetical protein